MSENIVPFKDLQTKRAAEMSDTPTMDAITNILNALEGMQTQLQAMTELLCEQDKRIAKLERRKIIQVRN